MSGKKWREFWIGPRDDEDSIDNLFSVMGVEQRPVWDEAPKGISIPVIEKAALEEKDAQIAKLEKEVAESALIGSMWTAEKCKDKLAEKDAQIAELVDIVQRFNDVYEDSNGKPTCDRLAVIALDTRSVLKKHSKSLSPDKGKSGEAATGGRVMTFEEKKQQYLRTEILDFVTENRIGHQDESLAFQTASMAFDMARQETLREVIPVLEKAVQHWGDYAPQRTNARQTLDEAKDLLKKLEAEREG